MLGKTGRNLLSMLDYQVHIKGESMLNTPPVFPIYVTMLTLRWIKEQGGVSVLEQRNNEKAKTLYAEIDRNSMFTGTVDAEDRSRMNVNFVLTDASTPHEAVFAAMAKEAGISGINGHRDVGGYRASLYNALPLESVMALVEVMQAFEKKIHG
jgi:phosphoserine aminotransferase